MNRNKYSHESAGYTDSISKEKVRSRSQRYADKRPGFRGLQQGLASREPMRSEFDSDPNAMDFLGGLHGKR
jgi:hypothetical protein